MDPVVITMDLGKGNALSQYRGIEPRSFCVFNGVGTMAGDTGVFTMTGSTDNGTNIVSRVVSRIVAPGGLNQSRLRFLHVAGEALGSLTITAKADETESFVRTIAGMENDGVQEHARVDAPRDVMGGYWHVEVTNAGGHYFTLDAVTASAVILPRKPRLR